MLVACSVLPFLSYLGSVKAQNLDPNQVYSTGNIVLPSTNSSSWVNGVYQPSLSCWRWGDPGYCGPNAIVRPGGNINFSFGQTNLHQAQAIANVLPNSGTGLVVQGYNFGFTAKNGNGWDDGRVDQLSAYVTFYDAGNNVAFNKNYNLNYKFNWTTFNYNETFQSPLAAKDLSTVQYGLIGRDNNGWAGPYGPEVYGVNFSLKYSVDPCSVDPMSKPTCPGYLQALAKLSPPTAVPETVQTIQPTLAATAPVTTPSTVEVTQPVTTSNTTTTATPTAVTSNSTTNVAPSASNSQPRAGEVTVAGSQSSTTKSTVSTSQILSILNNEQSRLSRLEMSTATAAVEQTKQDAAKVVAEAVSVASAQQAQTLTSAQMIITATSSQNQSGGPAGPGASQSSQQSSIYQLLSPSTNQQQSVGSILPATQISLSVTSTRGSDLYSLPTSVQQQTVSAVQPQQNTYSARTENESTRQQVVETTSENKQLLSVTSPIALLLNPPTIIAASTSSQQQSTVNRNTEPNDVAGGRDISSIAKQPPGFDAYSAFTLKDIAFYKPDEVYKNQVNVDNARALRQLSSDRLHNEMVEQQYKR